MNEERLENDIFIATLLMYLNEVLLTLSEGYFVL